MRHKFSHKVQDIKNEFHGFFALFFEQNIINNTMCYAWLNENSFKNAKKLMWAVISEDKLSGRIARTIHIAR